MTDKTIRLSGTGRATLTLAGTRADQLVLPPKLPVAAARQVVRSLLNAGLLEEVPEVSGELDLFWREGDDGVRLVLRATAAGIAAVAPASLPTLADTPVTGVPPPHAEDETKATAVRMGLRQAAEVVLVCWEAAADEMVPPSLLAPLQALRTALNRAGTAHPVSQPREGTEQARVLAMLRRPDGATVAQISEATAWQSHTIRAFLTGLRKKGMRVEVVERVRQLGPDKAGAKGSYGIYRLADEVQS